MLFDENEIKNFKILKKIALIFNDLYANKFLVNNTYSRSSKMYINIDNIFKSISLILIEIDDYLYRTGYTSYGLVDEYESHLNSINFNYFKNDELTNFNNWIELVFNSTASFLKGINDLEEENKDYHLDVYKVVNKINSFKIKRISNLSMPDFNYNFSEKNNSFIEFDSNGEIIKNLDYNAKEFINKIEDKYEDDFKNSSNSFQLNYEGKLEEFQKLLSSSYSDFKKKSDNLLQKFNDEITLSKLNFKKSVDDEILEFGKKFSKVDTDFKNTVKDFEVLKKFINAKGEKEVTDHYRNKAKWERITYWLMTLITFGIIIYSVSMATNGLNEYKSKANISVEKLLKDFPNQPVEKIEKLFSATQSSALTYLVLRLLFSILLFSSIIYTSRVAYRAYIHMRHSENMMLKLATLRPFINQLDESERNQIHKDLVPDYFGKDAGLVDGASEKFKDLPANVSAVAMKAIEQIGGSTSNNITKESNTKEPKEAKNLI
ncbi:hypothetical protein [Acinetobacter bereziniae]|uniref:hypothetical protein n=1 Tax=Acinetobacter bereziniae TaxID=106648 RepID=UPI003009C648